MSALKIQSALITKMKVRKQRIQIRKKMTKT